MKLLRILLIVAAFLGIGVLIGHVSGNQPERDSVGAAEAEIGVRLESRRIDVGDVTLHVVLAGPEDGPPVVLLHGFPEFWYAWRGPMAVLAKAGFRVIVPDQRGYNESDKPEDLEAYVIDELADDVAGLIEALGYEKAHLSGHDWGGGVAWRTVIRHPNRVDRFVVIDTPHPKAGEGFESEEDTVDWYRTFIQLPWLPGWAARVADWSLLTGTLRDTSRPGTFPEDVMDQYRSAWDNHGAITTMGDWYRASFRLGEQPEGEMRVSTPTLVLVAPDDAFIPGDMTRRSLAFLDDGEIRELERGSHWVIQEDPQLIGDILVEFFSRSSAIDETEEPGAD